jgi:hypothetical protein
VSPSLRRAPRAPSRPARPALPAPAPPLPAWAWAAALAVAATAVLLAVTYRLDDRDVWQHLLVGRVIWERHTVPATNLWTWPTWGEPYVLPSWLFRALLWPFWAAGQLWGLAAWRWLTALGAFALLWRATRAMGARGLLPLVVLVWAAMLFRQRTQLRPDTLVAVLLAAELWWLERRRAGRPANAAALVPLGWVWVNAHISWPVFFLVGGAYLLDALARARRAGGPSPRGLALALLGALALAPLNPFGFRALAQPFEFLLHGRGEPIFALVIELQPVSWAFNARNGLALFAVLSPLLALLRARTRGLDLAEAILVPALLVEMLGAQRFVGPFAIVAAPFLARDLAELLVLVRRPAWAARPGPRAALACAACALVAAPELMRPIWPLGIGTQPTAYPVAACDWIEAHGVRGRSYNVFSQAGWLLWRFWPQRDRLPFMDIHQTGTREDRDLYAAAFSDPAAWRTLESKHAFDWVLLPRKALYSGRLPDVLDADPAYALVFADDVALLYVRRDGPMAAVAAGEGFRLLPGGTAALPAIERRFTGDAALRDSLRTELRRQVASSPRCAMALNQLANVEALDGHWSEAAAQLARARGLDRSLPGIEERERLAIERARDARR